jgi:DNA-binding transcriptional ArsR family regulator
MGKGPRRRAQRANTDILGKVMELQRQVTAVQEAITRVGGPVLEAVDQVSRMRDLAGGYLRLVELYQRFGSISPEAVLPELKDPIAVDVVKLLFEQGGLNVTQLTERLRGRRGRASRTSVRERLERLVRDGIVVKERGPGGVTVYSVAEWAVERWLRLIGVGGSTGGGGAPRDGRRGSGSGGGRGARG